MGTTEHIGDPFAIMIRKWDVEKGKHIRPNPENLDKQMKTLHRKMKKAGGCSVTYYSIEKDSGIDRHHIHLLVFTLDVVKVKDVLMRYINGSEWVEIMIALELYDECKGTFGLVHINRVRDLIDYTNYISKAGEYNILV
jgi:hypothetical protein